MAHKLMNQTVTSYPGDTTLPVPQNNPVGDMVVEALF
jgi:hypothetical protein